MIIFSVRTNYAYDTGVFGSPVLNPSLVNNKLGMISGARIGVSLGDFIVGGGVYSQNLLKYVTKVPDENLAASPYLEFTYFGPEFEYIFLKFNNIYLSAHLFGGFAYTTLSTRIRVDVDGKSYNPNYGIDWFYLIKPSINFNYKLTSWMHLCTGANYRISSGAEYNPNNVNTIFNDDDYSGLGFNIGLKLGLFY